MGSKNRNNKINNNMSTKAAAGATGNGGDGNGGKRNVIEDPRFSRVHYDPKFQKVPKHKSKVTVDSRFSSMLTDKDFATSSTARVDKRGRAKKKGGGNDMERYYHFDDDEKENSEEREKEEGVKFGAESGSDLDGGSESSGGESDEELDVPCSSSDESTTDDDEDGDEMIGDEASLEVENVPLIEKETHRLAVVNMDWSHVRAVDLFVMLSSSLPKGGQIKSVTVYPSEFGLKRMEEEAIRGPVTLFEDEKRKDGGKDKGRAESDSEDEDRGESGSESDGDGEGESDSGAEDVESEEEEDDDDEDDDDEDDDDEIDPEKLRAYEKSRLRYYYAVVDCDSAATADYIYKNFDGVEFERSSNVLDLRFIPDSMEFKIPRRDVATEAPVHYEGLDFQTRALQQSYVGLSWDDDIVHRSKTLRRNFTEKELAEMDVKEFLASDESEDESDEDEDGDQDPNEKKKKKADKYRALLLSGNTPDHEEEDKAQEMEVTFNTGLEDISKKILEKKGKGKETVFEAYLRKQKEKKKARKDKAKNSSDDDGDESDDHEHLNQADDFFEEEGSVEKGKKVAHSKKKRDKKLLEDKKAEASQAELELLLADENGAEKKPKGYKIKQKKAKGKKGDATGDESKLPAVEIDDPRFSALFNNPGFALDPTDPQFKRSATYYRQLAQKQQKIDKELAFKEPIEPSVEQEDEPSAGKPQAEKAELSVIVKSLKMKSQQLPVPSSVKVKGKMESNGSTSQKRKHKLHNSDPSTKKKAKVQG